MISIAFSPCPNDTFIFHALVHGQIENSPEFQVRFADIDQTNQWAQHEDGPDILKISFAALPWVNEQYRLLRCGGALGIGCGPLIVSQDSANMEKARIAVPSERSTAYLLFRLWFAEQFPGASATIVVMPFHEIMPAVKEGKIDAGLVIHEARFTYANYGLSQVIDLGEWWETSTGFPIPLGAIVAKKTLDLEQLQTWIQQSVRFAWEQPLVSRDYVLAHAQEMEIDVVDAHIKLYVNHYSAWIDDHGMQAIRTLFERASRANLLPDSFGIDSLLVGTLLHETALDEK